MPFVLIGDKVSFLATQRGQTQLQRSQPGAGFVAVGRLLLIVPVNPPDDRQQDNGQQDQQA